MGFTWHYVGCYIEDTVTKNTLNATAMTNSSMTVGICHRFCDNYMYAGIVGGTNCYCGD